MVDGDCSDGLKAGGGAVVDGGCSDGLEAALGQEGRQVLLSEVATGGPYVASMLSEPTRTIPKWS